MLVLSWVATHRRGDASGAVMAVGAFLQTLPARPRAACAYRRSAAPHEERQQVMHAQTHTHVRAGFTLRAGGVARFSTEYFVEYENS